MGANTDVLVLENKISLLLKPVYNYHDRCHKNLQPSFADNSLPYVFTSALIIWLLGVGWNNGIFITMYMVNGLVW